MTNKKKPPIIQISFKDDEMELYYRIVARCKLMGKSGWCKEAALEKLEREDNPYLYMNTQQQYETPLSIVNSVKTNIEPDMPINKSSLDGFLNMFN